ncbi:HAD-IA family hydrolase [Variovorax sp. J2P1-59]|uniref:HAD-IA family hydrolase n=1 Tax=Variovorax flavidus TaxID=3053501 RepID=UPI0025774819|nr:HAD-IA family hydrolase [Variovorax sp. J2P1-59]MDM0077687.1 HAD-IA family hydrolase [Variovorax sp. J2P1-59]
MKPEPLRALIFDFDGTLADTESAHRAAFNDAFAEAGLDWYWDEPLYTQLLEVCGGKERIRHYWARERGGIQGIDARALADTVQRIHDLKTAYYARLVHDGAVQLRPGVLHLIHSALDARLRLAIATTTSPINIAVVLRSAIGPDWARIFQVVEDASTASRKKPHPQGYLQALQRLGVRAAECLAFEDSANGLQAAIDAGLPTVVTPNAFTTRHDFTGALHVLSDLQGTTVADLRDWHATAPALNRHPRFERRPCPCPTVPLSRST